MGVHIVKDNKEFCMAKKAICMLLLVCIAGCGSLWAMDVGLASVGGSCMLAGLFLGLLPMTLDNPDTITLVGMYGGAGVLGVGGLALFIWGLVEPDSYARVQSDPVLQHVKLDAAPSGGAYIGVQFKF
jgi:hypothetical protein